MRSFSRWQYKHQQPTLPEARWSRQGVGNDGYHHETRAKKADEKMPEVEPNLIGGFDMSKTCSSLRISMADGFLSKSRPHHHKRSDRADNISGGLWFNLTKRPLNRRERY